MHLQKADKEVIYASIDLLPGFPSIGALKNPNPNIIIGFPVEYPRGGVHYIRVLGVEKDKPDQTAPFPDAAPVSAAILGLVNLSFYFFVLKSLYSGRNLSSSKDDVGVLRMNTKVTKGDFVPLGDAIVLFAPGFAAIG